MNEIMQKIMKGGQDYFKYKKQYNIKYLLWFNEEGIMYDFRSGEPQKYKLSKDEFEIFKKIDAPIKLEKLYEYFSEETVHHFIESMKGYNLVFTQNNSILGLPILITTTKKEIRSHFELIHDQERMSFYKTLIEKEIKEGDIILDLGTGSGILGFYAIKNGARKVYSVDARAIIGIAEKLARINKLEEKMIFIKDTIFNCRLPERVDIILHELFGNYGLDEGINNIVTFSKNKFLSPGGKIVPNGLEIYLQPVGRHVFKDFDMDLLYSSITRDYKNISIPYRFNNFVTSEMSLFNIYPILKETLIYDTFFMTKCKQTLSCKEVFVSDDDYFLEGVLIFFHIIHKSKNEVFTLRTKSEKSTHWHYFISTCKEPIRIFKDTNFEITLFKNQNNLIEYASLSNLIS